MNFSDNLKKIRKDNNLSQEELAEKLGVSRQSVSKWESNQAYPEMDKIVQLCKMFNLNLDELINKDIKEVNETKQSKNTFNNYINDFLKYCSKVIDMFSTMKFKEKIKCIFEQIIIAGILTLLFALIYCLLDDVLDGILGFAGEVYFALSRVLTSLYVLAAVIFGLIILIKIFKTRYLDYYEYAKEEKELPEDNTTNESKEILKGTNEIKTKEKIIIRDPKHSEYRFLNALAKMFLLIIKTIAFFIGIGVCCAFIAILVCLVVSFLLIKNALLFLGLIVTLLSLLLGTYLVIKILYNFIVNHHSSKRIIFILIILSLLCCGIGIGIIALKVPDVKYIKGTEEHIDFVDEEFTMPMNSDLVLDLPFFDNYVESNSNDIKIIYRHHKDNRIREFYEENIFRLYWASGDFDFVDITKDILNNLNHNQVLEYDYENITVYASKKNIEILKANHEKYYKESFIDRNCYCE